MSNNCHSYVHVQAMFVQVMFVLPTQARKQPNWPKNSEEDFTTGDYCPGDICPDNINIYYVQFFVN